jgi:hypothetical protein
MFSQFRLEENRTVQRPASVFNSSLRNSAGLSEALAKGGAAPASDHTVLPPADQAAIADAVATAAAALGLREGPIHAEARLNERGPWLIEVAARSIGGYCSSALRFASDTSLEELILRQAARLDLTPLQREPRPAGVMMIPIPHGGILHAVRGRPEAKAVPGVEEVSITIPYGEQVVPLPRGNRYLGFIHARAATYDAVLAALREAHGKLEFDIRGSPPAPQ